MSREKSETAPTGETSLASMDIGSHTARLLVAQRIGAPKLFEPLFRKRVYIRLAQDFPTDMKGALKPEAIARTLNALEDFASVARRYGVENTRAVCTGVVREASNRDEFLRLIYNRTGMEVEIISGEEEAWLTEKGVLHGLGMENRPSIIFDLGGGSTEFICRERDSRKVKSVPLGAVVLTQKYLTSDPPKKERVEALGKAVDRLLGVAFSEYPCPRNEGPLVGTGGTVTTLAAMIYAIDAEEIRPERMNGLILETEPLEDLFARLRTMTTRERLKLSGLDPGRADVIPAGCLAVSRILRFFKSPRMVVCLSDLLEGILIAYLKGEKDE
ncbi:MAG: Ppx/GppA family phosphatase [Deltaproteobacteria bacterium]|nr:MAG: Ppx/GppA family phosphatase [Deltaproteobacteria bacterium]